LLDGVIGEYNKEREKLLSVRILCKAELGSNSVATNLVQDHSINESGD
jgi:hypothetical protein